MATKGVAFERDYTGDTPERIKLCLRCPLRECNNCLENIPMNADISKIYNTPCANGLRLSKIDMQVLDNYVYSKSDRDLASKLGVPYTTVQYSRTKLSLPSLKNTSVDDRKRLVKQWKDEIRMGW